MAQEAAGAAGGETAGHAETDRGHGFLVAPGARECGEGRPEWVDCWKTVAATE